MKLPKSPCRSCPHASICPDNWYGCVAWNTYFQTNWPTAVNAFKGSDHILRLYHEKKNDREIADAVGLSAMTIFQWRKRNDLPSNGTRGPRRPHPEDEAG